MCIKYPKLILKMLVVGEGGRWALPAICRIDREILGAMVELAVKNRWVWIYGRVAKNGC